MTLLGEIIKKVKSIESLRGESQRSPPPDIDVDNIIKRKKKPFNYYPNAKAKVDTSAPLYPISLLKGRLLTNINKCRNLNDGNLQIVQTLLRAKARVDSHWLREPAPVMQYYHTRVDFQKAIQRENKGLHVLYTTASPKIVTTRRLNSDWSRNRRRMIELAKMKFILFAPIPQEDMEDTKFLAPAGVKRVRLYLTLRTVGAAVLGRLLIELFNDTCPLTVKLFLELLTADPKSYSYIKSIFFMKVPNLFWTGGDVVFNNGFGCYAQKGHRMPIGAENFHFPHSMPGLLSMRVSRDNEVCGIFNITFKALPQFDMKNVVFGRVNHTYCDDSWNYKTARYVDAEIDNFIIKLCDDSDKESDSTFEDLGSFNSVFSPLAAVVRPCETYEAIKAMGYLFGSHPVITIDSFTICQKPE